MTLPQLTNFYSIVLRQEPKSEPVPVFFLQTSSGRERQSPRKSLFSLWGDASAGGFLTMKLLTLGAIWVSPEVLSCRWRGAELSGDRRCQGQAPSVTGKDVSQEAKPSRRWAAAPRWSALRLLPHAVRVGGRVTERALRPTLPTARGLELTRLRRAGGQGGPPCPGQPSSHPQALGWEIGSRLWQVWVC